MTSATRSTEHATFAVERHIDAEPARVWAAWSDAAAKRAWFAPPNPDVRTDYTLNFGVDEHARTELADGTVYDFDAVYVDVVDGVRFVYTYDMHCNGERISVSVATVELLADGDATTVVVTEQGVYLDGLDKPAYREHGIGEQLAALDGSLHG
ncbi:MAG: polyketide cyclase [Frankiales bacterium]|nr:polyketide cyclase [Frankiales bacterium]